MVRQPARRASLVEAHSIILPLRCDVRAATAAYQTRVTAMTASGSCVNDSSRLIGDQWSDITLLLS
jgi:hypothetical protein